MTQLILDVKKEPVHYLYLPTFNLAWNRSYRGAIFIIWLSKNRNNLLFEFS